MKIDKFHDTTHLQKRVLERGLSFEIAKNVISYHDTKHQQTRGKHGGFVYRFEKTVDGKKIAVAAELKKTECWIMTVFEVET